MKTIKDLELEVLIEALTATKNNKSAAGHLLGISRGEVINRIKERGLQEMFPIKKDTGNRPWRKRKRGQLLEGQANEVFKTKRD